MLIALLAVLGVDLIVIVVFVASVLTRRAWVSHRPGAFAGVARIVDGQVAPLGKRVRRGYGRWVRDILVWTPGPLFLRNALVAVDALESVGPPQLKVRRLGDDPKRITLAADGAGSK